MQCPNCGTEAGGNGYCAGCGIYLGQPDGAGTSYDQAAGTYGGYGEQPGYAYTQPPNKDPYGGPQGGYPQPPVPPPTYAPPASPRGGSYGMGYVAFFRVLYVIMSLLIGGILILAGLVEREIGLIVLGMIVGALNYFILNFTLIMFENIAKIGRNTERNNQLMEQLIFEMREKQK